MVVVCDGDDDSDVNVDVNIIGGGGSGGCGGDAAVVVMVAIRESLNLFNNITACKSIVYVQHTQHHKVHANSLHLPCPYE